MEKGEHLTIVLESVIIILVLLISTLVFSYFRHDKQVLERVNRFEKNKEITYPDVKKFNIERR